MLHQNSTAPTVPHKQSASAPVSTLKKAKSNFTNDSLVLHPTVHFMRKGVENKIHLLHHTATFMQDLGFCHSAVEAFALLACDTMQVGIGRSERGDTSMRKGMAA
jgi:hypothetical protein